MKNTILTYASVALIAVNSACKHDPFPYDGPSGENPTDKPCDPDTVYFQNQILPLLTSNCAMSGCHDAATAEGDVILTSYQNIMQTADVRPGNPNGSDLYEVVTETDPDKRMPPPPAAMLSQEQQQLIYTWIQQGARNNSCNSCDTASVKFSTHVLPVISQNCQSCHGASNPSGGVSLMNYTQVKDAVLNKNLVNNINYVSGYKAMPPGGKLPNCDIRKVAIWVADGMPNN
jgi:uncharacterized membrane protein